MPFRDPTTTLILPPGISIPPPVGSSAIFFDPGPPPVAKFYTGSVNEIAPGQIAAPISGGNPQLELKGPDTGGGQANFVLGANSAGADEPFIEAEAEDFSFRDFSAVELLHLIGTNGFAAGGPKVEIGPFESDFTVMQVQTDFDATDQNANVNTSYATVGGAANPGLSFVAPPSGRGWIVIRARVQINTTAAVHRNVYTTARLGTGDTIGAGTAQAIEGVTTPTDDHAWVVDNAISNGTVEGNGSIALYVSGLTAGDSYNLQMQHKLNSAVTANYDLLHRSLQWFPIY